VKFSSVLSFKPGKSFVQLVKKGSSEPELLPYLVKKINRLVPALIAAYIALALKYRYLNHTCTSASWLMGTGRYFQARARLAI